MAAWLASSRRFTAFVAANQTKIRKKLRAAHGPEIVRDLQLELEPAYLLRRERSLILVYEPQQRELARGPDFAVNFTTSHLFMVEVTRLRSAQPGTCPGASGDADGKEAPDSPVTAPLPVDRFSDVLCSKLGQLLPQRSNILIM